MNAAQLQELDAAGERLKGTRKGLKLKIMTGMVPPFASALDPRFSFTTYVPTCHAFDGPPLPLVVLVHGTLRATYLNDMVDFAEQHKCVVLAPLFPCGIIELSDIHNYKTLLFHDIRFDLVLISMIDQASRMWRIRTDKFFMHGFSGGGQFCHRFFYLHHTLLAGISIGAPGGVTIPRFDRLWPSGLSDLRERFHVPADDTQLPDFAAMAKIPVQFVIGEMDLNSSGLPDSEEGGNRMQRIMLLRAAWLKMGIDSVLDVAPGVGHEGAKVLPQVQHFLGPLVDAMGS